MMRRFWVLSLLVLTWACGRKPLDLSYDMSGGTTSVGKGGASSHKGGGGAGGTSADAAGTTSLAPTVEILSPDAVSDPNDENVLVSDSLGADTVDVVCQVQPSTAKGAAGIDTSSVKIALLDGNNKQVQELPGLSTSTADRYTANFALAKVPAGVVSFRCKANDLGGHSGTATISSLLDHGPTITVNSPVADTAYARQSSVHFEFTVDPAPLADGDDGAKVADVTLTVGDVVIDTTTSSKHPNVYSADVDFSDMTRFPPKLTGKVAIEITATNSRKPQAITQTEAYTIALDGAAPTVTIKTPAPGTPTVVGGQVQIIFTVDDGGGSGVDQSKLVVLLNDQAVTFDAHDPAWDWDKKITYSYTFDISKLDGSVAQVTVGVQASDLAGNGPSQTASVFLYLDNKKPFVTLTPFEMRAITHSGDGKETYCSAVFNPMGESIADGAIGHRFTRFRVFAWDRTNAAPSQDNTWFAGIDTQHVTLYMQPDSSKPILLDADGDGTCDTVSPDVKLLPALSLLPIPGQGTPDNNPPDFTSTPSAADYPCISKKTDPQYLCPDHGSDLTYVIKQNYGNTHKQSNSDAAIYASEVSSGSTCTGSQWEVASAIKDGTAGADGWLCLTAEARDTVGNIGVAAPLRVCLVDETDTTSPKPACATTSMPLPSCVDHCTPPPRGRDGDDSQGNPLPIVIEYP